MSRSLALVILALAMAQAYSLPDAWIHSPYDSFGMLAAIVWAVPILLARRCKTSSFTAWSAVVLGVASAAFDFRVLGHAALAMAAAALAIRSMPRLSALVWLLAAISWMPALSYISGGICAASPAFTVSFRLCLAALGCITACLSQRRPTPPNILQPCLSPNDN